MSDTARKCFVSMPAGPSFADVYASAILPALAASGLTVSRAEDLSAGALLREGLIEQIRTADLVVAVADEHKSNNFTGFELGAATALKKPIILIARSFKEVPFDLQHIQFLSYNSEPESLAQLQRDLIRSMRRIQASREVSSSSPIAADQTGDLDGGGDERSEEYVARGEYTRALQILTDDVIRHRARGGRSSLAKSLNGISVVYQALGRLDEARSALQEAFGLLESVGEPRQRATIAVNLANVMADTGDLEQARTFYKAALSLAEEIDDPQLMAETRVNYAYLLYMMGNFVAALESYQYALAVFGKIGDEHALARTQANLAGLLQQMGRVDEAESYFKEALYKFDKFGDRRGEASILHNLGSLLLSRNEFDQALTVLEKSLALKRRLGDLRGSASSLATLGHVWAASGKTDRALTCLAEAAKIQESIGDRYGLTRTLFSIGIITAQFGDAAAAESVFERSLAMAESIGAPERDEIRERLLLIRQSRQPA